MVDTVECTQGEFSLFRQIFGLEHTFALQNERRKLYSLNEMNEIRFIDSNTYIYNRKKKIKTEIMGRKIRNPTNREGKISKLPSFIWAFICSNFLSFFAQRHGGIVDRFCNTRFVFSLNKSTRWR